MKSQDKIRAEHDRLFDEFVHLKWVRDKYGLVTEAGEDFIAISAKLELLDWIIHGD